MPVTPMPSSPFTNEPFTDFTREENRRRMQEALDLVRAQFGKRYQLVIAGERYTTPEIYRVDLR